MANHHEQLWLAHATMYVREFKLSVIPMRQNKKPAIKWAEFQERRPRITELVRWEKQNLAVVTGKVSNIVIVDCESREDALWFWDQRGQSPAIVRSRRGYHFWFRHPGLDVRNAQKVRDESGTPRYDIRGDGGYALVPPSFHPEGYYRWEQPLESIDALPVFDMTWRPVVAGVSARHDGHVRDAVEYISHIPAAAGDGGHNATFRAACILRRAGLGEAEALLAMQAWNRTNADPPWRDDELLHKVKSAFRAEMTQ